MSRGRAAELTALPAATADDDDCCTRNCVSMSWSGLLGTVVVGGKDEERERDIGRDRNLRIVKREWILLTGK